MIEQGIWGKVVDGAISIVDQLVEDKDAKQKAKQELKIMQMQAERELMKAQLQANIEQAKHPSVFVAGARPAFMWMMILIIGWTYVGHPVCSFFLKVFVPEFPLEELPVLDRDLGDIMFMLGGMLGLCGWRSFDKANGVARNSISGDFPTGFGNKE